MKNQKHLFCLLAILAVAGCANPQPHEKYTVGPSQEALKSRITRDSLLSAGGICNVEDICFDREQKQDYDCTVEFDCVPTQKKR